MKMLVGFVAGYVLGARAGKERYAELCAACRTILGSRMVRHLVSNGSGVAMACAQTMLKRTR